MTADAFDGTLLVDDQWRHHDFTGQRVGVIARGRDAAGVLPTVLRTAGAVKLFQDDPDWVLPMSFPAPRRVAIRLARVNLRLSVHDEWTRRLLTPDARFNRRASAGPAFYRAVQHPNCTLIAWPIYDIVAHGVRTAEGIEHQIDCLVIPNQNTLLRLTARAARKASA